MKKIIVYSALILTVLVSCKGTQVATYNDDVYANPVEDKKEAARLTAEQKKRQEAIDKRYNDSIAAVREKENSNPAYKTPEYNKDDYYDYEYASRLKRFDNSVSGLGYYDNYYTNAYWYSGNPYQYGVSIYNGYNFWPSYYSYNYYPSSYFYTSFGWGGYGPGYGYGFGYGYPYGGYNNAYWMGYYNGYNHGYNNGWWGYPYGGYGYPGYGYGGYGNPYGWGYYNGYDQNSQYTYAPRTSHGGGNSNRVSNPGMNTSDPYYQNFVQGVVQHQAQTQKFTDVPSTKVNVSGKTFQTYEQNGGVRQQNNYTSPGTQTTYPSHNGNGNVKTNPTYTQPTRVNENSQQHQNVKESQPVYQNQNQGNTEQQHQSQPTKSYFENNSSPSNNGGNGGGNNSSPRNGGGGFGGGRPR